MFQAARGVPSPSPREVAALVQKLKAGKSTADLIEAEKMIMDKCCDARGKMNLATRMEFHRCGAPLATLEWMRRPEGDCEEAHVACWRLMYSFSSQLSQDNLKEQEPKRLSAQLPHYRSMMTAELERRPLWLVAANWSLKFASKLSTVEDICPLLVSVAPLLKACVDVIKTVKTNDQSAEDSPGPSALAFLQNLSIFPGTHVALRAAGTLEDVAIPLLAGIKSEDVTQARMAIRAGSIICRMLGKDESGQGPELIQNNPTLIESFISILKEMLAAGPSASLPGINSDPANMVYDLSVLAKSDRNKPLLVSAIPVLASLLEVRKENRRLSLYTIQTLSQLTFEPSAAPLFAANKDTIVAVLGNKRLRNRLQDDAARNEAALIVEFLKEAAPPIRSAKKEQDLRLDEDEGEEAEAEAAKDGPSQPRGAGLLERMASNLRPASLAAAAAPPPPPPPDGGRGSAKGAASKQKQNSYVFLSYQWDAKPLARAVPSALRGIGINTWIDDENMIVGKDLLEAMAEGVENSACVVAFFSDKYKESVNCRREAKWASKTRKPIIFVRVEPNYFPQGWLGLLMEETLWLDMSIPEKFAEAVVKLQREIESKLNLKASAAAEVSLKPLVASPLPTASSGSVAASSRAPGPDVVAALESRLDDLETMLHERLDAIDAKLNLLMAKMEKE